MASQERWKTKGCLVTVRMLNSSFINFQYDCLCALTDGCVFDWCGCMSIWTCLLPTPCDLGVTGVVPVHKKIIATHTWAWNYRKKHQTWTNDDREEKGCWPSKDSLITWSSIFYNTIHGLIVCSHEEERVLWSKDILETLAWLKSNISFLQGSLTFYSMCDRFSGET